MTRIDEKDQHKASVTDPTTAKIVAYLRARAVGPYATRTPVGEKGVLYLLAAADRLERPDDGSRPHRQPKGMAAEEGDVLAWVCQACGEVVSEFKPRDTPCPINWRRPDNQVVIK